MKDRIKRFLIKNLEQFYFNELSPELLKKAGMDTLMKDVPVPIAKDLYDNLQNGQELKLADIAKSMLFVLGCDEGFVYCEHYKGFLLKLFGKNIFSRALADAANAAEGGNFLEACIGYRACLAFKNDDLEALQGYARVCRELYLAGEDEDEVFVGSFKAESLEKFEYITVLYPEYADAYYYLGYGYANLGLYVKADIAWKKFIELADKSETEAGNDIFKEKRLEIKDRILQLKDPVQMEIACNDIMAGRYEEGIKKLSPYTKVASFDKWWPMWYYLGIAYGQLGEEEKAIEHLKKVLLINPSNTDAMLELVELYQILGDYVNAEKYANKIKLINS